MTDLYAHETRQGRRLPPHVLTKVNDTMQVMQDEIFGPLLPLVPYDTLDDALAYINQRPRPRRCTTSATTAANINRCCSTAIPAGYA